VTYAVLFLCSAALSFLLAYPVRGLALRLGVVDHPEKRKMHQIPIPLMGGLAVAIAFALVSARAVLGDGGFDPSLVKSYLGIMTGGAVILALGLYDDIRGVKAPMKFAGQALAAFAVVAMGARVNLFTNPLGSSVDIGWVGIPVTVLWIVGVTNAMNLIDGLDGLAVGIGGIAALGLFAVSAAANPLLATLTIVLAGAAAGFLPHNFYPARMFLGDTGSMFIGYMLAVVGVHGSFKATTATVLFLPIVVLGMPLFDTVFAIFRRARRRVSPFKADREHIHHRLVRIGLHHRNVVLVLYFVCAYLALTAYAMVQFPYQTAFLFMVLLTMGGIIGLRTLRFIEDRMEPGLAGPDGVEAPAPAVRSGVPAAARPRKKSATNQPFSTLVCEVGGFGEWFGEPEQLDAMCEDLSVMLARRLRVHAITAHRSGPSHVLLVMRTEPLKPAMQALLKDGLTWYLDDQRDRFAGAGPFPSMRWISTGLPHGEGSGTDGPQPARSAAEDRGDKTLPFPDRRATVTGS
jgi:UDP-GlcNAc:undecaprenyl-phosphate GlcNAc-1-phosphate transferase